MQQQKLFRWGVVGGSHSGMLAVMNICKALEGVPERSRPLLLNLNQVHLLCALIVCVDTLDRMRLKCCHRLDID